jgi:hypothetical protein
MTPYIEDVYPLFYGLVNKFEPSVAVAAKQFKNMCEDGKQFTDKQANYLLSIMVTHKNQVPVDLTAVLDNPAWRLSFRQIDTAKRVWVEDIKVFIQFPYSIKSHFEAAFDEFTTNWDSELRIRTSTLYDINIIQLYDFAVTHGFEIDPSFEIIALEAEDYLQAESSTSPYSISINEEVYLVNSSDETDAWFESKKTGNQSHDIFLAKQMGYVYKGKPKNLVEEISTFPENAFWMNDVDRFLSLCYDVPGKICIVLDRASDNYKWLYHFIEAVKQSPIELSDVKYGSVVKGDNPMNELIIQHGLNKNSKHGKIIIFIYQPTKSLIAEAENVMMLVTNNLYPSTNGITRDWLDSHPCVIHLSEYCPTTQLWSKDLVKM